MAQSPAHHRAARRTTNLALPPTVRAAGEALLDQQMWCWGCDVRRAEGNLLAAYGCVRRPAPDPRFPSAYDAATDLPDGSLTLWGWGMWVAAPDYGSLFVSRTRFAARWLAECETMPSAWQERDLPAGCATTDPAHAAGLLCAACQWIAAYERWVAACCPAAYRAHALDSWPARRRFKGGVAAEAMASAWEGLGEEFRV